MLFKIIGMLMMIFGVFMVIIFPAKIYQRPEMTAGGLMIGLVILIIGLFLLVFG